MGRLADTAPCGSWGSPITAGLLVAGAASPSEVVVDAGRVWWSESRPDEGGRSVVVCDGVDAVPPEVNVRTLVHEYGGGAWWAFGGTLVYSDHSDQRLYRLEEGGSPTALTPEPESPRALRYADGRPTADGRWYVCVRESHGQGSEPVNDLVAVALDGSLRVEVLVSGPDFVSSPRISPDGARLAWVQWDHPNLPWDDTELWVADFDDGVISGACRVGGGGVVEAGSGESFFQPGWNASGVLHVVTDRDGWWHLYRLGVDGSLEQMTSGEFEVGTPQWVFGLSRYAFVGDEVWFARRVDGVDRLSVLADDGTVTDVTVDATSVGAVSAHGDGVVAVVASWASEPVVAAIGPGGVRELGSRRDLGLGVEWFPVPESVCFPTSHGEDAYALVYPPTNPDHRVPDGERPPLLVLAHGGPTGSARTQLQLSVAYWTSRGFVVADVDYRGSTGYGRPYRHRLWGEWGVVDVEDCVAVAGFLAGRGDVDVERMAIKGGSAGGFTVLAAVTFHDVFSAGASRYGVADLAALAADTHKFEARYLDRLVGAWPGDEVVYRARSPVHHTNLLATPMLLLQGAEDPIVPPDQARSMADALGEKGVPFAYLEFPDEGHGFRRAPNIVRALEAELSFFAQRFGFDAADDLPPLDVDGV
ncbi:MAG: Dipeptidyl aminopeptidase BIII [Acidimicrobiaceae bacterium]|nr:Dipeptidyl aminopeptidase BIII [Acidimicrobiaceae bacterium]